MWFGDYIDTPLGPLPKEWEVSKVGDFADIKYGKANPKSNGSIPVVGSGGIYDWTNVSFVNFPTIVVGRKGTAGRAWLMEGPSYPSDTTFYLDWKQEVDIIYLYGYLSLSPLSGEHAKTTIPSLTRPDLENKLVPLPPLPEQRAIANVLSRVRQSIEATERVIAATRELKRSMMKHLFTYGPVPVAQADQVPLKETEIGDVPEDWRVRKISDYFDVQGGFSFKSKDFIQDGVPLFRISNVSFGKVDWETIAFLPYEYLSDHSDYVLVPGDIVMAITRPVVSQGIKIARLSEKDTPCLLNQRVCRFKPRDKIDLDYVYQYFFSQHFINAVSGGAIGSHQPNISTGRVGEMLIPLAPPEQQHQISQKMIVLDLKINSETNRKFALDALFNSLLHHLMTGKIRVRLGD